MSKQRRSKTIKKTFVTVLLLALGLATMAGLVTFFIGSNDGPPPPPDLSSSSGGQEEGAEVVIYFSKNKGSESVIEGVIRHVPEEFEALTINFAIEALLTGPSEDEVSQGYFSEIPQGTQLIEVTQIPGEMRVNLSKQFISGGGSNSMQQRLNQLTGTIRSVEQSVPVYVEIEGEQLEVLGGEGVMVKEPVNQGGSDPR